jgi:ribosomal protein S18 acetylase RimI-like enzyme
VGFCYGYPGEPGQYWTEYVRGILGSRLSTEWALGTHFEIAELAVEAPWRGVGVGKALITTVMDAAPAGSTFLLGTNEHADPALGLYHSLGFEDIRGNAGYVVLGKR